MFVRVPDPYNYNSVRFFSVIDFPEFFLECVCVFKDVLIDFILKAI